MDSKLRSAIRLRPVAMAALLITGAIAIFRSASADTPIETVVVKVGHVDVKPKTPAAAMRTLNRLKESATEACGGSPFSLAEYKAAVRQSACWHDAISQVVARLESAELSRALQNNPD